jgi:hypothetical protein
MTPAPRAKWYIVSSVIIENCMETQMVLNQQDSFGIPGAAST